MPKLNPNILIDPLGGLNAQFGVPTCMLGLAADVLALLPGDVLGSMHSSIAEGMGAARSTIASITKSIFRDLGILEYDTTTGRFVFISDASLNGMDGGLFGALGAVGSFLNQVAGFGAELWRNYTVVKAQIDAISDCIGEFKEWLEGVDNKGVVKSAAELAVSPAKLAIYKSQISIAQDFLDQCAATLLNIEQVFADRDNNPALIPQFTDEEEADDPIFRLTFGPPQAKQGQFLLSVDGLYYDSQTREYADGEDVPTLADLSALEFIPDSNRWLLDHAPNLGGRGGSYSLADLNKYVDTIFDLDIIDTTKDLQVYYDADHLVQFLISQKNKRIEDIHNNLADLNASGYSTDSAIYLNFEQQIISESASFNNKINKRKKQIEVAVKTPDLFGVNAVFQPGCIPVNDFSYLSSINLDVEIDKQRGLAFDHGEVSGVILPVIPKYVHAPDSKQKVVVTPLLVTPPGAGSIVDGEELETEAPLLSLVTGITTDELIAVYNFTDVNFQDPSSLVFNTLNCNSLGMENRAQTVTNSPSLLFQKGLGVPYLTGIPIKSKLDSFTEFTGETWSSHEFTIEKSGNYVRLPDTQDYQDLMYNPKGATISFWTHIPGLYEQESGWWEHPFDTSSFGFALSSNSGKWCDGHYYRVLLGCENTGGLDKSLASADVTMNNSSDNVKGMLMGISRDPRMYFDASAVLPGINDFDVRAGYGAVLDGVTLAPNNLEAKDIYGANASGTWTVSSNLDQPLPTAFIQASGTFVTDSASALTFTVGSGWNSGDGYTSSANGTTYNIYTTDGVSTAGLSGLFDIKYFDSGSDKTLNMGTPSSVFFIAPTLSYNTSSVGFVQSLQCAELEGQILKFTVPDRLEVSGNSLLDCVSKFIMITVVFDTVADELKFYINGNLIKTGAISETFDQDVGAPPQIPSFIVPRTSATSSFEYTSGTVTQYSNVNIFDNGPKNNTFFTPWIVGGGWTDGRNIDLATSSGGFLDTGSGIMSPYNGYVGSLKIYKKALDNIEINKNYNHQKKFFENIEL